MFLTARILCLNEEDYIWYSLKSMYDAVDRIIIVEGCTEQYGKTKNYVTNWGLSIDNTAQEIERFMTEDDPETKVVHLRYGFAKNYAELANRAVELIPKETTHFLNVDADEVYKAEDIQKVKNLFEKYPRLCGVAVDRIHFYLDLWTRRRSAKAEILEGTGGTMFRRYYQGESYPDKSAEHNPQLNGKPLTDRWLPWHDNIKVGIETSLRIKNCDGITLRKRMMPQYHYGWVRNQEKMLERVIQTYRRSDRYSGIGRWDDFSDQELAEYIQTYNPVWTGILPDEDQLVPFEGKHPEPMKEHPFYNIRKEDFGWL